MIKIDQVKCMLCRVEGLTLGGFLVATPKKMADISLVFPGFDGLHLLHISSFLTLHNFCIFLGLQNEPHIWPGGWEGKGNRTPKNAPQTEKHMKNHCGVSWFCGTTPLLCFGAWNAIVDSNWRQDVKAFFLPIALREVNFLAGMAQLPEMMGKLNSNFSDNPPDCVLLTSYISHLYPWIVCQS